MENDLDIRSSIKKYVHDIDPKADVWLFGSRARNDAHEESDWDILILSDMEKVTLKDEEKYIDHLSSLMVQTGQVIQILLYSARDWNTKYAVLPLYQSIKQEGIKL